MKTVILAGGIGSRLNDATRSKSKALVTIGGLPILAHIMRIFIGQGHLEFVVAIGHHAESVIEYFSQPNALYADPRASSTGGAVCVRAASRPGLSLSLVDTGADTGSAGRLLRLRPWLGGSRFFLAWCDGLADLDLGALLSCHVAHGRNASVVAVRLPARFGSLTLDGDRVTAFEEKPDRAQEWINGGFFVLEPAAIGFIEPADDMIERGLLPRLAAAGELMAFRHQGFWDCMDTPADRERLEALWRGGQAPWRSEEELT